MRQGDYAVLDNQMAGAAMPHTSTGIIADPAAATAGLVDSTPRVVAALILGSIATLIALKALGFRFSFGVGVGAGGS